MRNAVLLLGLVACGSRESSPVAPPRLPADAAAVPDAPVDAAPALSDLERILQAGVPGDCKVDADCTITRRGCCGCGTLPARADAVRALELELERICPEMACPAVIDERPICRATPVCRAGQCAAKLPE